MFLTTVKNLSASEINSIEAISTIAGIFFQFVLVKIVRRIGNLNSVKLGVVLLFLSVVFNTFSTKYIGFLVAELCYEIGFVFKSMDNVNLNCVLGTKKNGEYKSFFDFIKRCYGKSVNKKTIESLVNAGAFDIFNYNHKTLIESIDIGINYAELVKDLGEEVVNVPELDITEEYDSSELIKREYASFGFYLSYHPVQNYRKNNFTTMDIKNNFNKIINIYLLIDNVRTIVTKKGEKMAFITGSDEYGEIDMVMFPRTYEKYYNLSKGEVVLISAKVEKRINQYQLVINSIQRF